MTERTQEPTPLQETLSIPTPRPALSMAAVLTLIAGTFLPTLSFFIVNVALPSIGHTLQASPAALQLVVGTYGIANAVLVVVGGRLGDGYGRKRLFMIGMAGFMVFSLLCALAPTIEVLLMMRIGQGATAAMMAPQVLATISATLTDGHRARAIGIFGAAGGVAAALGQILGGVLVSADIAGLGWRAVFLLNVPLCLIALAISPRLVPETRADQRIAVDGIGALFLALTLGLLLFPLTEGRPLGWPAWIWLLLAAVAPLVIVFAVHQRRIESAGRVPLLPPSILSLRPLRLGLLVGVAFFTIFGGFMFVIAIATQSGAGMSPLEGGLTLLPVTVSFLAVSIFLPQLQQRFGGGLITRGWIIQAVGYLALGAVALLRWPDISPLTFAVPMLIIGLGEGMVMMPLFGVVLSQVPASQAGLGSGVMITMQQTCLSFGSATVGTAYLAVAVGDWGHGGALATIMIVIGLISVLAVPLSRTLSRA